MTKVISKPLKSAKLEVRSLAIVNALGPIGMTLHDGIDALLWKPESCIAADDWRLTADVVGEMVYVPWQFVRTVALSPKVFEGLEYAIFCGSDEVSRESVPLALGAGVRKIVDCSGAFAQETVQLHVGEHVHLAWSKDNNVVVVKPCATHAETAAAALYGLISHCGR